MSHPRWCLLLLVAASLAAGQSEDKAASAYKTLLREYESSLGAYRDSARAAKNDDERQKVFRDIFPHPRVYAPRFLALADEYPRSPAAFECLAWVVTHPVEASDRAAELRPKALQLLKSDHLGDDRLGRLCTGLVFTIDPDSEAFLRHALAKSPSSAVEARACTSLAQNLKYRARLVRSLDEDADQRTQYEKTYGKALLASLRARKADDLLAESRRQFALVVSKHSAVKHPTHGTLAKLAEAHLESLRHPIALDQPAPQIEGTDVNGKVLKLSDFKGKVVLLDFWGDNFPACGSMYEYEAGLVKRMAGKPFVLLGVNSDPDRAAVKKLMADRGLTWRSWWDGGDVGGPIATRWDVDGWPTLIVIDHKGVVRHISAGWPSIKEADETIDKMVAEAAK